MPDQSSVFELIRLPAAFQGLILSFFFILLLAPYFSGANFGIFRIPEFTPNARRRLKLAGPFLFTGVLAGFVPVPAGVSTVLAGPTPILLEPEPDGEVVSLHEDLRWRLDSEAAVSRYEVQLSQNATFGVAETKTLARPFLPLDRFVEAARSNRIRDPEGKIHWRVRAIFADGTESDWSEPGSFYYFTDALDRIRRRGCIRIATSSTQGEEIFAFLDAHNSWTGLDIELIREIAKRLSLKLDRHIELDPYVVTKPWSQLLPLPRSREVDLVISSITISPEREELHGIVFSDPYFVTRQALVSSLQRPVSSLDEMQGSRLGVQKGTTGFSLGKFLESSMGVELVTTRSPNSIGKMYRALEAGKIDALLVDEPYARKRNGGGRFAIQPLGSEQLPESYSGPRTESYGIVAHPDDRRLLMLVNDAIGELSVEGYLDSLATEFLGG